MKPTPFSSISPGTTFWAKQDKSGHILFAIEPSAGGSNGCPVCETDAGHILSCVDSRGVSWHICPNDIVFTEGVGNE